MSERFTAKAGRFIFDAATKKVKVSKEKGQLSIFTNEEGENHISWVNLDTKIEELDIIVFPFDAVFEKVQSQNNTYVLRFQSNQDRYFFYLQEKINPDDFVKSINDKIAYVAEESEPMEIEVKEEKMDIEKHEQPKVEEKKKQTEKLFNNDFIQRLQANLMAAKGNEGHGITHLSKILTPEAINNLLSELTPEEKESFVEFLPEQQKHVNQIASNIRSPQFQQAADVLSDALNSENAIPLFMQLGLDQKHLKKHYGVHAFLKALEQWAQKTEKKE